MRTRENIIYPFIRGALSLVFWIAVWEIASLGVKSDLILPGPLQTLKSAGALLMKREFYIAFSGTLLRVFGGVALSVVLGIALGIAAAFSPAALSLLTPVVSVFRSLPVVSISILLNLWLKSGFVPLAVCFFVCFPNTFTNMLEGVRSVDGGLVEMAALYKVPFIRQLKDLYLPSLRPFMAASVVSSVGMGWKATVTAEVLASVIPSVGMNIYYSKLYLNTGELFAWTILLVIVSMLIEWGCKKLFQNQIKGK